MNEKPTTQEMEKLWKLTVDIIKKHNIWGGELICNSRCIDSELFLIEACSIVGYTEPELED